MSEWQKVLLGDVCQFRNGKKASKNNGNFPIYGGNGILGYSDEFNLLYGLIIGRVGAYCGSVFLSKTACWVSDNAIYVINGKRTDTIFLYYLLSSLNLNRRSIGSGQPLITQEILKNISIFLPPLDIQKKIAGVLGALDDKIELNNKINQNLEAQAQALFKSLYNMENNGTLNDIIDTVETGNRPKGGARSYGIPSIGAENIEKFGVYDYSKEKFIDKDFYESMKRGKVKSGDVLLYKDGAYTGKVSLALDGFPHKTCAVNEHVFIIRGNPQISSQFFIYFCLSNEVNKNYLHTLASSKAAQPGLNQAELLSLPIFIPPIDLLKNFTNNVSSIMHKIAANALENVKLSILRDTLLPKLMNGEIDVDNVKID